MQRARENTKTPHKEPSVLEGKHKLVSDTERQSLFSLRARPQQSVVVIIIKRARELLGLTLCISDAVIYLVARN